jgi:fucose permease
MEVYACCNCLLCFVAVVLGGAAGTKALVAVSFFMSIMYPTIFTTAIVSHLLRYRCAILLVSLCRFSCNRPASAKTQRSHQGLS